MMPFSRSHIGAFAALVLLAGSLPAQDPPGVAKEAPTEARVVALVTGEGVRTVNLRRREAMEDPLPEGALLVVCDELQVATRAGAVRCTGHVLVKAGKFQARAGEMLVAGDRVQLQGAAELWRLDEGDPTPKMRLRAERILFDRANNRLRAEDPNLLKRAD